MVEAPRAPPHPAGIGIFAPSGRVDPVRLAAGVSWLEASGHRVVVSPECAAEWRYFAGTDEERLAGLDRLVDDSSIDIVMAARGGYGLTRLLDRIDWSRVAASRKVFVGFSDFTAFQCAALARGGLATFHGPMAAVDFCDGGPDAFTASQLVASLWGGGLDCRVEFAAGLAPRVLEGPLWGGNLSLLAALAGTPFLPPVEGGLLYLEEVGEEPYAIERLFVQLRQAGVLARQRAILLGDFADCEPKNAGRYPYALSEAIETLREIVDCPVLEGLPFGHVARKLTLPFGLPGRLAIDPTGFRLAADPLR